MVLETLVDCMRVIAEAASNTPFYYYDINFQTGINCTYSTPARLKSRESLI